MFSSLTSIHARPSVRFHISPQGYDTQRVTLHGNSAQRRARQDPGAIVAHRLGAATPRPPSRAAFMYFFWRRKLTKRHRIQGKYLVETARHVETVGSLGAPFARATLPNSAYTRVMAAHPSAVHARPRARRLIVPGPSSRAPRSAAARLQRSGSANARCRRRRDGHSRPRLGRLSQQPSQPHAQVQVTWPTRRNGVQNGVVSSSTEPANRTGLSVSATTPA